MNSFEHQYQIFSFFQYINILFLKILFYHPLQNARALIYWRWIITHCGERFYWLAHKSARRCPSHAMLLSALSLCGNWQPCLRAPASRDCLQLDYGRPRVRRRTNQWNRFYILCGVDRIDQDTISREHFLHEKLDRIQQQQDLATCSGVRGLMSNDFSRETRILLFSQPWDRKGKRRTQL